MSKKFYNTPEIQLTECVMMKFAVCSGGTNDSGGGQQGTAGNQSGQGSNINGGLAPGRRVF